MLFSFRPIYIEAAIWLIDCFCLCNSLTNWRQLSALRVKRLDFIYCLQRVVLTWGQVDLVEWLRPVNTNISSCSTSLVLTDCLLSLFISSFVYSGCRLFWWLLQQLQKRGYTRRRKKGWIVSKESFITTWLVKARWGNAFPCTVSLLLHSIQRWDSLRMCFVYMHLLLKGLAACCFRGSTSLLCQGFGAVR